MLVLIKGTNNVTEISDKDFDATKHEKFVKVAYKKGPFMGRQENISEAMYNSSIHELIKEKKDLGETKELKTKATTKKR